jgi:DNA mismatch repair protein MSH5
LRPSKEFKYESGKNKLLHLKLSEDRENSIRFIVPEDDVVAGEERERQRFIELCGRLDMSCQITVCLTSNISPRNLTLHHVGCAGAVLSYLFRRRQIAPLPVNEAPYDILKVSAVEMFSVQGSMWVVIILPSVILTSPRYVNMDTIHSLQVFESESHPNFHNQGPSKTRDTKEGFSIYGLFYKFARTPQGKDLLRRRFLRPSKDVDQIEQSLSTISAFILPDNLAHLEVLVKQLAHIKNMKPLLKKLRKGAQEQQRASDGPVPLWSTLIGFCYYGISLIEAMHEMEGMEGVLIWDKMTRFDAGILKRVGKSASDFVDVDESRRQLRPSVRPNVDPALDELKRFYDGLDPLLTEVEKSIKSKFLTEHQDIADALEIGYHPGIGHVLGLPESTASENGDFLGCRLSWVLRYEAESET